MGDCLVVPLVVGDEPPDALVVDDDFFFALLALALVVEVVPCGALAVVEGACDVTGPVAGANSGCGLVLGGSVDGTVVIVPELSRTGDAVLSMPKAAPTAAMTNPTPMSAPTRARRPACAEVKGVCARRWRSRAHGAADACTTSCPPGDSSSMRAHTVSGTSATGRRRRTGQPLMTTSSHCPSSSWGVLAPADVVSAPIDDHSHVRATVGLALSVSVHPAPSISSVYGPTRSPSTASPSTAQTRVNSMRASYSIQSRPPRHIGP